MDELFALLGKDAVEKVAGSEAATEAAERLSGAALDEMGLRTAQQGAKLETARLASGESVPKLLSYDKAGYIDRGDEAIVYSNGDGTVTKVFHDPNADLQPTVALYQRLRGMGVTVPDILESGKTAEGNPALRIQQIGDGDHLQMQMLTGQIPRQEVPSLLSQYDTMAQTLQRNNVSIDWQLKNMAWSNGRLYMLDPSWVKEEPLSQWAVDRMRPRA